jgi:acetyl esterase/lipase
MLRLLLFAFFSQVTLLFAQSPPSQPTSGPGGSDYLHDDVIFSNFTSWLSPEGYWLFEPSNPKPDSANLVLFNHGYGVFNPGPYGQWIEHLVRKGNIVIFPKYQLSDASLPSTYTPNAIIGLQDALSELQTNPNRVKPRMQNYAIIGHSYGGVITSNMVTEYASYGIPKPKCFMLCQPGTGGLNSGRLNSYANMDTDYNALIVVGDDDIIVGDVFGREIMDSTNIPTSRKNFITHFLDNNGFPNLEASHNEPLSTNLNYDGGTTSTVITGGYLASKTDAVDYYCYWKLADALLNCTFYNTDCEYAFGDTPEQRYMGEWSDGTSVVELQVEPANLLEVNLVSDKDIVLFPNPVSDILSVKNPDDLPFDYEIFNVEGRLITNGNTVNNLIDFSNFNKGIFIVKIQTKHSSYYSKIIKE